MKVIDSSLTTKDCRDGYEKYVFDYLPSIFLSSLIVILPAFYLKDNGILYSELSCCWSIIGSGLIILIYLLKNAPRLININALDIVVWIWLFYKTLMFIRNGQNMVVDHLELLKIVLYIQIYLLVRFCIIRLKIIFCGFIIGGLLQSIISILQYWGICSSLNHHFGITGTFPNPSFMSGYLCVCLVIIIAFFYLNVKQDFSNICLYTVIIGVILIGLYIADSRSSILGLFIGLAYIFFGKKVSLIRICAISAGLFIFMIALYIYRPESALARLLIYRISLDIFADSPLFGHGDSFFTYNFMLKQANYFSLFPNSEWRGISDNVAFPYSEIINWIICYGVVGIGLIICGLYFVIKGGRMKKDIKIYVGGLIALVSFGIFSNPSYIISTWIFYPILLSLIIKNFSSSYDLNFYIKNIRYYTLVPLLVVFIGIYNFNQLHIVKRQLSDFYFNKEVIHQSDYDKIRKYHTALDIFQTSLIRKKRRFKISEQILNEIIPSCEAYCFLGEYYERKGYMYAAETYFMKAHQMVPNRITPLYRLWEFYLKKSDIVQRDKIGLVILGTKFKVENTSTIWIKEKVRKFYQTRIIE